VSLAKILHLLPLLNAYRILPGYHLFAYCNLYHLTNCDSPVTNDSLLIRCNRLPALSHRIWSPPAVSVRFLYIFFSSEYRITLYLVTIIPALPPGNHYLGPNSSNADPCRCSSVTYSAISACAGCQDLTYIDWLTWSEDCTSVSLTTFESIHLNSMITLSPNCVFPDFLNPFHLLLWSPAGHIST
jgi:hypothetical protein